MKSIGRFELLLIGWECGKHVTGLHLSVANVCLEPPQAFRTRWEERLRAKLRIYEVLLDKRMHFAFQDHVNVGLILKKIVSKILL